MKPGVRILFVMSTSSTSDGMETEEGGIDPAKTLVMRSSVTKTEPLRMTSREFVARSKAMIVPPENRIDEAEALLAETRSPERRTPR